MQWIMGDHALCSLTIDDIRTGIHLCLSSSYNILSTLLLMPSCLFIPNDEQTTFTYTTYILQLHPFMYLIKKHFRKYAPHYRTITESNKTMTFARVTLEIRWRNYHSWYCWWYSNKTFKMRVMPISARILDARLSPSTPPTSSDVLPLWKSNCESSV